MILLVSLVTTGFKLKYLSLPKFMSNFDDCFTRCRAFYVDSEKGHGTWKKGMAPRRKKARSGAKVKLARENTS